MPPRGQCARYKEYWDDDDEAYWQTESAEEEEEHEYTQILPSETAGLSEEAQQQQVEEDAHLSADEGVDVCAVCLSAIEPADLAIVKGCEHVYCVNCILQWALYRDAPTCPQCKVPFNYLYTHKLLDGQLSDCPVEESVCLLKRATWFVEHIKTLEKGKAVSAAMAAADEGPGDWANDIAQYFDDEDEYDEEEELEKFYFSSAAGRARVVLGNRRLGENGYMRAGRMYARPANNNNNGGGGGSSGAGGSSGSSSGNRAAGGNIGKAGKGRAGGAVSGPGASAAAGSGGGGSGGVGAPGQAAAAAAAAAQAKGPGQGRRAKRNARRAAADLSLDGLDLD